MSNREPKGRIVDYILSGIIPAGQQSANLDETISEAHVFRCEEVGVMFTTLEDVAGDITDTGVCPFRVLLQDEGRKYNFQSKMTPADLFRGQGRRKSSSAVNNATAPAQNAVYNFKDHDYIYTDKITATVANDSNTDNEIWLMFSGRELKVQR